MMKKTSLVVAALAALLFTGSAVAYTPTDNATAPAAPLPRLVRSSVVNPTGLPLEYAGATINVEFSLSAQGEPHNIRLLQISDQVLTRQVVAAFRQWRFERDAGDAVPKGKKYILPLVLKPEA